MLYLYTYILNMCTMNERKQHQNTVQQDIGTNNETSQRTQ